jgi:hypothetical protein
MDSAKGDVEAPFYPKNKILLPKVQGPTKILSGLIKIKRRLNHQGHQVQPFGGFAQEQRTTNELRNPRNPLLVLPFLVNLVHLVVNRLFYG